MAGDQRGASQRGLSCSDAVEREWQGAAGVEKGRLGKGERSLAWRLTAGDEDIATGSLTHRQPLRKGKQAVDARVIPDPWRATVVEEIG